MQLLKEKQNSIPIILGSGINAYGIIRSLGEAGIRSAVFDTKKGFSFYSKYVCSKFISADQEKLINELRLFIFLQKKKYKIAIIYPTSDFYVSFLYKNYEIISCIAKLTISEKHITKSLLEKDSLYAIAKSSGIDCPRTIISSNFNRWLNIFDSFQKKMVIKPKNPIGFKEELGKKAFLIKRKKDLEIIIDKIKNSKFKNRSFILQEYVPGSSKELYTLTGFALRSEGIIAYSTGYKIRQSPKDTGTIISGRVLPNKNLFHISQKLIKFAKYEGFFNIEFKFDSKNNTYKLIEINTRLGIWNYSATAVGVNLPEMSYFYYTKGKVPKINLSRNKIVWMLSLIDLYSAVIQANNNRRFDIFDWLKSIDGKKKDAIWNINDLLPFIMYIILTLEKLFKY